MLARILAATTAMLLLTGMDLPKTGPRPVEKPEAAAPAEPVAPPVAQAPAETPVPEARPEPPSEPQEEDKDTDKPKPQAEPQAPPKSDARTDSGPETAPATEADKGKDAAQDGEKDGAKAAAEAPPPPPPVEKEDPEALRACLVELDKLGTKYQTQETIAGDGPGCGIDKPIRVDRILPDVALAPAGEFRCQTALQLARWVKQSVIPSAEAGLPEAAPLTSVNQASTYICRNRNSAETGRISEHAHGNAVDIASLSFGKETVPMRIVTQEGSTLADAFQRSLNATACLFFTTVLSPGSDAAHQDHMHLDIIARKNGYRLCQ